MRTLISLLLVAAFCVFTPTLANAGETNVTPSVAASNAFEQGQAYERLLQDIVMSPGTCGIVLERGRCVADLATLQSMRSDATDSFVAKWFALGDVGLRVTTWNAISPLKGRWNTSPTVTWWYNAGIASIAASLPEAKHTADYVQRLADELEKHSADAPTAVASWMKPATSPFEQLENLQRHSQVFFPVQPYPLISFGEGAVSDAQLGVYTGTLIELITNPIALSRPETRAFATVILTKWQGIHSKLHDGITMAPVIAALKKPLPANREILDALFLKYISDDSLMANLPIARKRSIYLGMFAAQIAYNAAVFKDQEMNASFHEAENLMQLWPGISAPTRDAILALQQMPLTTQGGTWEATNAAATKATLAIMADK